MATFSLANFQTEVKTQGLARVNRFEVFIFSPRILNGLGYQGRLVSLFAEVSNFPPLNLSVRPLKIGSGPTYQRPIGSEYGGDGMAMTFHVDRRMQVKSFFDDWMQAVVDGTTYEPRYQEDYATEIYITQLDEAGNETYSIKLVEAFPRSMNLMELNQSSQNQTHRLNMIFAYRYWVNTKRIENRQVVPNVPFQTIPTINLNTPVLNNQGISWDVGSQTGTFGENGTSSFPVAP